jgi:hypothetical protein
MLIKCLGLMKEKKEEEKRKVKVFSGKQGGHRPVTTLWSYVEAERGPLLQFLQGLIENLPQGAGRRAFVPIL